MKLSEGTWINHSGTIVELVQNSYGKFEEKGSNGNYIYNDDGVRMFWTEEREQYWMDTDPLTNLKEKVKNNMKIILNHPMVVVVEENNAYTVKIRMRDGRYAIQNPFPADQRGIIGALTLALDVLAGKILLVGVEATPGLNEKPLVSPKLIELTKGDE